jgi:hypothetical protein
MYLLDTNIVSELRKPRPHGAVVAWIAQRDERELYVAAMTIGEIQSGIELTRAHDAAKAEELDDWLETLVTTGQVVPADARTFRCHARLMHRRSDALWEDALIAATALEHGLAVVTRNVRDFAGFEVEVVNPFEKTR